MKPLTPLRAFLLVLAVVLGIGLLGVIFLAYQQPALLIDFTNLVFCG